jgi:hypothetical protein
METRHAPTDGSPHQDMFYDIIVSSHPATDKSTNWLTSNYPWGI